MEEPELTASKEKQEVAVLEQLARATTLLEERCIITKVEARKLLERYGFLDKTEGE